MKVCFVGIGSIAQRHVKNLRDICSQHKITLTVDALRREDSLNTLENLFDHIYYSSSNLSRDYDAVFITNPTQFHLQTLGNLYHNSNNFFIEKPVATFQQKNEIEMYAALQEKICYVACPLRFTSVISYLKNNIVPDKVHGVRCICSSYLPDWRPGTDYRNIYSSDKKLGGGVSIDLIHEWDYIKYIFGIPKKIVYVNGKKSGLELNCEDYASYIAEYKDKIIELHLDYFGRKAIREIMILEENDTIIADLINGTIRYLQSEKVVNLQEGRDDYQKRELGYFLSLIKGKQSNINDISEAYKTLKLTQGIVEES